MIYVTHDANGKLTGLYRQDIHASHVGNYIQVDESISQNWTAYQANSGLNGIELAPPPVIQPIIPSLLTRRQFFIQLVRSGLYEIVEGIIAVSSDIELKITYQTATEFLRTNPMINQMMTALGKTEADVDTFFIEGVLV